MNSTSRTPNNPNDFNPQPRDRRLRERGGATDEGPGGESFAPSALDEDVSEQDIADRALFPAVRDEEDDGGSVSPEELGEQFLRGAAQQERRVAKNDAESPADVDLLSDSVHQVSLFDHNLDPLDEPDLPQVIADETEADAAHHPVERSASKRAARYAAEDRSSALGSTKSKPPTNTATPRSNKTTSTNESATSKVATSKSATAKSATSKSAPAASAGRAATSKPKAKAQGTKAGRSEGVSKTTAAARKRASTKTDAQKNAAPQRSSAHSQKARAASNSR